MQVIIFLKTNTTYACCSHVFFYIKKIKSIISKAYVIIQLNKSITIYLCDYVH